MTAQRPRGMARAAVSASSGVKSSRASVATTSVGAWMSGRAQARSVRAYDERLDGARQAPSGGRAQSRVQQRTERSAGVGQLDAGDGVPERSHQAHDPEEPHHEHDLPTLVLADRVDRCADGHERADPVRRGGGEVQAGVTAPGVADPVDRTVAERVQDVDRRLGALVDAAAAGQLLAGAVPGAVDDQQAPVPRQRRRHSRPRPGVGEHAVPQERRAALGRRSRELPDGEPSQAGRDVVDRAGRAGRGTVGHRTVGHRTVGHRTSRRDELTRPAGRGSRR